MASPDMSADERIVSCLALATSLPGPEAPKVPSFAHGLGSAGKSLPAPLVFSPLAYSLLALSRPALVCVESQRKATAVRRDSLVQQAEAFSRHFGSVVVQQLQTTLDALETFGAEVTQLLNLPVPSGNSGLRGLELLPRGRGPSCQRAGPPLFAAVLPGDSVAELVVSQGIFQFLNIYNTLLITRLVLTWFPNPPQVIAGPLATICDPYLNLFRGIIPPLGGTLDFSPILAFLVLNVFTNTAAALPAEIPGSAGRPMARRARGKGKGANASKQEGGK